MRLQSTKNFLAVLALVFSMGCATTTTPVAARAAGPAVVRTPLPQTENPVSDLPVVMGALGHTRTEISALQQRLHALRSRTHGLEDYREELDREKGGER